MDSTTTTSTNPRAISTHLESLAAALRAKNFTARLVLPENRPPFLQVANPDAPQLVEDITCGMALGELCYCWSWDAAITPVRHVASAAERIAFVLTPATSAGQ